MFPKIAKILGSIRFWMVTFAWLGVYLANVDTVGFNLVDLFNGIAIWLGTVAGIGTVDKAFENLGKK